MHAHWRASTGERESTTEYCPLDLYSCDPVRVRAALVALWNDWSASGGAGNNLRIFVGGKTLHPSKVRLFNCPTGK
jgi:inositol-pentakisphosphate 2-kinase